MTNGLTLDTGALLALERGDTRVRALFQRAIENRLTLTIPAGVVAQTWRGGSRQARVARLLNDPDVEVPSLDDVAARAVGVLCGRSGHADIVDAHVVLLARERGHHVVTSDPDDLRGVDPSLRLIVV